MIRVLVVDDSAFARKVVREALRRDSEIEVIDFARDGLEALEKIAELKPDVVTLDLMMPNLDGLGVLRALPKNDPPKVIVVSITEADGELGVAALEYGALDLVQAFPHLRRYRRQSELPVYRRFGLELAPPPRKPYEVVPRLLQLDQVRLGTGRDDQRESPELRRTADHPNA